jgi:exosortase/archaeosortase family protein
MDNETKKVLWLFSRYIFIGLIGLGNLYIFYKILTPLTVFFVGIILSLFMDFNASGIIFAFEYFNIAIVKACVAGSAFYLLTFLVFSTAEIRPLRRFFALATALIMLFVLNVGRIVFLTMIAGKSYFEAVHWTLWNLVSIFFVVAIWFFVAWVYKIKTIPAYSDILFLKSLTETKRKKNSSRKGDKKIKNRRKKKK